MATRATKRPLNKCGSCGHRWYPKGRSLSVRCPECRSTDTKKAGAGVGALVLVLAALAVFGGKKEPHPAADVQMAVASETQTTQPDVAASTPEPTLSDANLSGAAGNAAGPVAQTSKDLPSAQPATASEAQSSSAVPDASIIASQNGGGEAAPPAKAEDPAPALPAVRDREHH